MNLYEQKFGNPQRVPCPDRVAVFRQKKGGSVTDNVVWACLLKHGAASPALSQTLSARQRRQPSCPGWAPSGGGQCLSAELCEGPLGGGVDQVHAENPESLSEVEGLISCWINGKKESICQELTLQLFLFQCSHFSKSTYVERTSERSTAFHSLHASFALSGWRAHYGGGEP